MSLPTTNMVKTLWASNRSRSFADQRKAANDPRSHRGAVVDRVPHRVANQAASTHEATTTFGPDETRSKRTKPRLADWVAAPQFTWEERCQEYLSLSEMERAKVEADIFGRSCKNETSGSSRGSVEEEEEGEGNHVLVPRLQEMLKARSSSTTRGDNDESALQEALRKCPQLLTEEHLSMFLTWAETATDADSDVTLKMAMQRLCAYWTDRLRVFGPDKAFCPLTLRKDGALAHDSVALRMGFFRYLHTKDEAGRALVYIDPASQNLEYTTYTRESMHRAVWYKIHSTITTDPSIQRTGLVFLFAGNRWKITLSDRKAIRKICTSIVEALPVRVRAFHCCHMPTHIYTAVHAGFLHMMGRDLRFRTCRHNHNDAALLLHELEPFQMGPSTIPTFLGGTLEAHDEAEAQWLAKTLPGFAEIQAAG